MKWLPRGACGAVLLLIASQLLGHGLGCMEAKTPADHCVWQAHALVYEDGESYASAQNYYRACLADAGNPQ